MELDDRPFSDEVLNALLARLVDSILGDLRRQHYPAHGTQLLAKQLEAVAWLYYRHFHRLFGSLDYYDPGEFCKKLMILRCGLDNYLDKENGLIESRIKLSSEAADFSSGDRKITRASVLLLSPDRRRGFLVKNLITESCWSFIEVDVKHVEPLLGTVLSAVQKIAGFEASSLEIEAETYQARCMNQAGDFTRLYVMVLKHEPECNRSETSWIKLEELLLHVNGDWLKKNWDWEVTPAMDYFHVHPFITVLSEITNSFVNVEANGESNSHSDKMEWSSSEAFHPPTSSPCQRKLDETVTKEMIHETRQQVETSVPMIVLDSEDEEEEKLDSQEIHIQTSYNQVQTHGLECTENNCSNDSTITNHPAGSEPTPVQQIEEKQDSAEVQTEQSVPSVPTTPIKDISISPVEFSGSPEKCISEMISAEASELSDLLLGTKHQQERIQNLMELTAAFQSQAAAYNAQTAALHQELVEGETELQNSLQKLGTMTRKIPSEKSFLAHLPDPVKELEAFCVRNEWPKPRYEVQTAPFKSAQFTYTVIVHLSGRGIQHSEKGSSGTELHLANQSAAAAMLGRLYMLKSKSL